MVLSIFIVGCADTVSAANLYVAKTKIKVVNSDSVNRLFLTRV